MNGGQLKEVARHERGDSHEPCVEPVEIHHDPVVVGRPGPDVPIRGEARAREGVVDEDASREEDRSPEDKEERQSSRGEPPHAREKRPFSLVQERRGGRFGRWGVFGQVRWCGIAVRSAVTAPPLRRPAP